MRDVLRGGVLLLALVTLMACNAKEQAGAPKAKTVQTASEPASPSEQEPAKPAVAKKTVAKKTVAKKTVVKPAVAKKTEVKPAKARLAKPSLAKPGATKLTRKKPLAPKLTKVDKPKGGAAAPFTPAELPPVKAPSVDYPGFTGKRVAIIHTENIIGELEPCG